MRVSRKCPLIEGLECGFLSHHATIFESLGPSLLVVSVNICLEGKVGERLWNEAGTGYLPGSNKVKVWGGRS